MVDAHALAGDGWAGTRRRRLLERALHSGSLPTILPLFLLLGLGLSFTPCVLPMLPILSSMIVAQKGGQGRRHGSTLSLSYALGMAVRFFGVLMLGTALWIVSPVMPPRFQMLGWALLGSGYAIALLAHRPRRRLTTAAALLAAVLGGTQMVGLAMGGADPLAPFAAANSAGPTPSHVERIASVQELDAALASSEGKTVMLDFYADWCVSCKEMERFTFSDERVRAKLGTMRLFQVDVTENSAADQALLARFGLFGPPGIVFFGPGGKEVLGTRVIGYQKADKFLASLAAVETGSARLISPARQQQEQ